MGRGARRPFVERLHAEPRLKAALAGVTAVVVGVIANLALWFGVQVPFGQVARWQAGPLRLDLPVPGSLHWDAPALSLLAAACLSGTWLGLVRTLGVSAAAGLGLR